MLAPSTRFLTEWRPLAALGAVADAWRDLCARAAEPNAFYEPAFALAAAPVLGSDAGAVLVWSPDARLAGLFPLRLARRRYGLPLPLLIGWTHDYGPFGVPLVDRDRIDDVVASFLDHVAAAADLPKLVLMPCLAADGVVARALAAEAARRGGRTADLDPRRRALLATTEDAKTYLDAAVHKNRRQKLARQRRRLAESGGLRCDFESDPARVEALLDEFLAIEQSGWKGRARTAAAQDDAVAQFMRRATIGLARDGKLIVGALRHAGHAIAATLVLRSGAGAWVWKIAYDEQAARYSPGVQIVLDLTARLLGDPAVAWTDSCATPDHPMIDRVWRERLALTDRLIAVAPGSGFAFTLAWRLESLRHAAIALAKRLGAVLRRA